MNDLAFLIKIEITFIISQVKQTIISSALSVYTSNEIVRVANH